MLERLMKKGRAAKAAEDQPPQSEQTTVDEFAEACKAGRPKVALVGKYEDRVPVQIKSAGHLEQLRGSHGAGNVEVQ